MVFGHKTQQAFLKRIVESGRIPHAFLFAGPESVGKRTLALQFFGWLAARQLKEDDPDLQVLTPQVNKARKEISISQIREVKDFLRLKPFAAPFKSVLIDGAEAMRKEAQNCLLKTLEEPPAHSLIALVSSRPKMLLPTVLSRCLALKFQALSDEEMRDFFKDKTRAGEQLEKIIFLAEGRPGRALKFLENPQVLEKYYRGLCQIEKIVKAPLYVRFQYLKNFFDREKDKRKTKAFLGLWQQYFRTLFLFKLGAKNPPAFSQAIFSKTKQVFSLPEITKILEDLEKVQFLLGQTNINPKLALENLFLKI